MRDVAERLEFISLPLRLAMLADRAAAGLRRVGTDKTLDDLGRQAMNNVLQFIEEAKRGETITRSTTMRGYSRHAIQAYRLSERVIQPGCKGSDTDTEASFLEWLQSEIKQVLSGNANEQEIKSLNEFFSELAKLCLSFEGREQ